MFRANELRNLADNHNVIKEVTDIATDAASKGLYEIIYYRYLHGAVIDHLEKVCGFEVEDTTNRFTLNSKYKISWR